MNYNYKLLKYKNKLLNQYGGNIDESIRNLKANGFSVEEHGNDKTYRMLKVTRNDDRAIFFIKLMNDYPASKPIICYNGKNIFNLLDHIRRPLLTEEFDHSKYLAALLVRETLLDNRRKALEYFYHRDIVEKSRLDEILEKDIDTKQKIRVYNKVLEEKKVELARLNKELESTKFEENKKIIEEKKSVLSSNIRQIEQMLSDLNKITPLSDDEILNKQLEINKLQKEINKKNEEIGKSPAHMQFSAIYLNDQFLNQTDQYCYDILPLEELERLKSKELDKKVALEKHIIDSTTYLYFIRINKQLYFIHERLRNIYANLYNKTKDPKYEKERDIYIKICKFMDDVLKKDDKMNIIKDDIQRILDTVTVDTISKDDVTDKNLIELIKQFNTIFNEIYDKYNCCHEPILQSKAEIIKKLKEKWISEISKEIIKNYGSKELSVIYVIKFNKLIIE